MAHILDRKDDSRKNIRGSNPINATSDVRKDIQSLLLGVWSNPFPQWTSLYP